MLKTSLRLGPIDRLRRDFVVTLGAGFAAGCSTSPTLDLIGKSIARQGRSGNGKYPVSDEQIRAIPYATLGVAIGRSAPAVMVLANVDGDDLHWASADHGSFVTRKGRLISTRGLKRDLVSTDWLSIDQLAELAPELEHPDSSSSQFSRSIEVGRSSPERVRVLSKFSAPFDEQVHLFGGLEETRRVNERIVVDDWRWAAQNIFWLDPKTGIVRKSLQQYCPEIPPIVLEVLKPIIRG